MFKYYLRYVKSKIAEAWEYGESASEFIQKPTVKHISRDISVGVAQTLDIPSADYWYNLIQTSKLINTWSKSKRFDPRKMPSLFQRTWDAALDNMLDDGREWVEKPSSVWYTLKPNQILLRKYSPDDEHDWPHQYEFKVYNPSYLKWHFGWEYNS